MQQGQSRSLPPPSQATWHPVPLTGRSSNYNSHTTAQGGVLCLCGSASPAVCGSRSPGSSSLLSPSRSWAAGLTEKRKLAEAVKRWMQATAVARQQVPQADGAE